ncbi:hypothetical protein BHE17_15065 [Planococcus maritimus]|nr:hypothetical protein AY633_07210 [Planococcus maritimus]OED33700.1 hypothetical protein BHE17_15065 [Planococcus maritimus]
MAFASCKERAWSQINELNQKNKIFSFFEWAFLIVEDNECKSINITITEQNQRYFPIFKLKKAIRTVSTEKIHYLFYFSRKKD